MCRGPSPYWRRVTATLTFHRKDGWTDRFRAYTLSVNGRDVATIKRNTTVSVEVEARQHLLMASIDWCASPFLFVNASDGGETHIEVSNPHGPWKAVFVVTRKPLDYLLLRVIDEHDASSDAK